MKIYTAHDRACCARSEATKAAVWAGNLADWPARMVGQYAYCLVMSGHSVHRAINRSCEYAKVLAGDQPWSIVDED